MRGGFDVAEGLARTEKRTGSSLRWSKRRWWDGAGLRGRCELLVASDAGSVSWLRRRGIGSVSGLYSLVCCWGRFGGEILRRRLKSSGSASARTGFRGEVGGGGRSERLVALCGVRERERERKRDVLCCFALECDHAFCNVSWLGMLLCHGQAQRRTSCDPQSLTAPIEIISIYRHYILVHTRDLFTKRDAHHSPKYCTLTVLAREKHEHKTDALASSAVARRVRREPRHNTPQLVGSPKTAERVQPRPFVVQAWLLVQVRRRHPTRSISVDTCTATSYPPTAYKCVQARACSLESAAVPARTPCSVPSAAQQTWTCCTAPTFDPAPSSVPLIGLRRCSPCS